MTEVERFFGRAIYDYNCGDIELLLDDKTTALGPLLSAVAAGVDTVAGMMFGFTDGAAEVIVKSDLFGSGAEKGPSLNSSLTSEQRCRLKVWRWCPAPCFHVETGRRDSQATHPLPPLSLTSGQVIG